MENGSKEAILSGDYFSYLLRLWREIEETVVWRASLQDTRTGERMGFATLDDLMEYIRHHVEANNSTMTIEEKGGNDRQEK